MTFKYLGYLIFPLIQEITNMLIIENTWVQDFKLQLQPVLVMSSIDSHSVQKLKILNILDPNNYASKILTINRYLEKVIFYLGTCLSTMIFINQVPNF